MVSKSEQKLFFWEEREIIYSDVPPSNCEHVKLKKLEAYFPDFRDTPSKQCYSKSSPAVVIVHALMRVIHKTLLSSPLLYANFLKLLGKKELQGLSLPQCLRLCESEIEFLYFEKEFDENNGAPDNLLEIFEKKVPGENYGTPMPDVSIFKVFEDINLLNKELRNQKKSAPTKFEIVQESLKDGHVKVKMDSREFTIIACKNDQLFYDETRYLSAEELNERAIEACLADDREIVIFQDFSVENNTPLSKASLVVEVLKKEEKPVIVGMRIGGSLHCVLILHHDSEAKVLYAKRWEGTVVEYVSITFKDFNRDAIEAYFLGVDEGTSENEGASHSTDRVKYYDSVIFHLEGKFGFELYTGNDHGLPELVLNTNFEITEAELIEKHSFTLGLEAGVAFPEGPHGTASAGFTSETQGRLLYRRIENDNKVAFVQNAWKTHPSSFSSWDLKLTNKTSRTPLIPTINAMSFHVLRNGDIIRYKFKSSWIRTWNHSEENEFRIDPKIFKKSSKFRKLKKVARKLRENDIKPVYKIMHKQQLSFEEWPDIQDAEGFLCILKLEGPDGRLYCGWIRTKTQEAEETLIQKFNSRI